jgi:hypothetical protein
MTLSSKLVAQVVAEQRNSLDLAAGSFPLTLRQVIELADGTGANQANQVFSDRRTLAASATDSLDLAGGLVDAFGATLTMARVKALYVAAASTNANTIRIGGAATNAWATWVDAADNEIVLRPGGMFLLAAPDATGYPVTAATGDLLEIVNGGAGTPVTYDIVIIGASA